MLTHNQLDTLKFNAIGTAIVMRTEGKPESELAYNIETVNPAVRNLFEAAPFMYQELTRQQATIEVLTTVVDNLELARILPADQIQNFRICFEALLTGMGVCQLIAQNGVAATVKSIAAQQQMNLKGRPE